LGTHLAVKRKAWLLAGDDLLRRSAEERKVSVRGLLWVLDELVERQAITSIKAAAQLERLLKGKARLPKAECECRLKEWRGSG
jgi:predicted nucleic acid-binding protein